MKTLICTAICFGLASIAFGQLPSPSITGVFPPGGSVGKSIDVTLAGRDLDDAIKLVFSHAGIQGKAKYHAATEFEPRRLQANQFTVDIADNVSPGVYEARAIGQFGVSTPFPFVVSKNVTVVETGNNHSPKAAQKCSIDSMVFGHTDSNAVDHFRFSASKGQKIFVRCMTKRIDSRLQPVLVIRSSTGKQLARSPNIRVPEILFVVPDDGNYTVCVNDHIFSGGPDYAYAISISNDPILDLILPIAAQAGTTSEFILLGRKIPGGSDAELSFGRSKLQKKTVRLYVPPIDELQRAKLPKAAPTFGYRLQTAQGDSNELPIYLTSHAVVLEDKKNDRTNPQRVKIPVELNGTFYPRRDEDWIRFAAKKGQELLIDLIGNRLETQTDPALFVWQIVVDGKGNETLRSINVTDDRKFDNGRFTRRIPRAYDSSSNDPTVRFKVPQDADYCVSVRDLFGNARADFRSAYRLIVQEVKPDFDVLAWSQRYRRDGNNLRVEKASPTLRPGETLSIPVDVNRHGGFNGDVTINVNGLPNGVVAAETILKGGKTEGVLFLTASQDAPASLGPITISGTASIDGRTTVRGAKYGTLVTETGNIAAQKVVARPTSEMWLAVLNGDPISAAIHLASEELTFETSLGGKIEIPITYDRSDAIKGDLKLLAIGLPSQVKGAEVNLKPDAKAGKLPIEIKDAKTPIGSFQIFLDGQVIATRQRNKKAVSVVEGLKKEFESTFNAIVENEKTTASNLDQVKKSHQTNQSTLTEAEQSLQALAASIATARSKEASIRESIAATQSDSTSAEKLAAAEKQLSDVQQSIAEFAKQKAAEEAQLNELKKALKASTTELNKAELQAKDATEKKTRAEAHKKTLEERFNTVKKANEPKDTPFVLHSRPFTVNIVKSPLVISLDSTTVNAALSRSQDSEVEIKGNFDRRFGFSDAIDAKIVPPKESVGLKEVAFQLAKDKKEFVVKLPIGKDAKPGKHTLQLSTKIKFNGIEITDSLPLVLTLTE